MQIIYSMFLVLGACLIVLSSTLYNKGKPNAAILLALYAICSFLIEIIILLAGV